MARSKKRQPEQDGEETLDFRQAQEFLNTTRVTLYRWIAQKRVRAFKAGRQWRFYRSDLAKFLEQPDPSAVHVNEQEAMRALEAVSRWQLDGSPAPRAATRKEPEAGADAVAALADAVLEAAVRHDASDVHLDPTASGGQVRLRIDGVLHPVVELTKSLHVPLVGQFKQRAEMDIADRASMQSGRIAPGEAEGAVESILAATLPTPRGEKLTLRLLSSAQLRLSLDDVDLGPSDRERLDTALRQPTGIVLMGGPTGSGKTTTLYAALRSLITPRISVVTIESTVSYWLPGAVQVQTNPRGGITYATALQGVMRSDPDVIAVLDVPDGETAAGAVEHGLSGHMVLLQLHANDAVSATRRLIDLGVEPFLLASSLVGSMNQRLVRRVCSECKEGFEPDAERLAAWRRRAIQGGLDWPEEAAFIHGKGCERCRGTGYFRRTAIYEVLLVNDEIAGLLTREADADSLREAAVRGGMTTLFADGMRKALAGVTSPLEVVRVT